MADQPPSQPQPADLEECFRNFREQKFTKDNLWSNHFINDFQRLIAVHHQQLGTFQLVGSMLEASSQLYGLKVDSIYSDVLRLSSGVRRENIIEPTESSSFSVETSIHSILPRRRVKTTIVGNSQLINAELQTIEEPNCLIKLKGTNEVSAKNLLQNVLASDNYALSLQSRSKFWTDRIGPANELSDDDSAIFNADCIDLPASNWVASSTDVVRPKVTGYAISNVPCDNLRSLVGSSTIIVDNVNQLELEEIETDFQFDISVDAPQIEKQNEVPQGLINESLTEDDRNSLVRCPILQKKTVAPEDLRPLTVSPSLEYSYRPITEGQISTGPNHWKLPSAQQTDTGGVKKRRRRKLATKDKPVVLRNVLRESIDKKFVSTDDPLIRSIRKVCYANWDPIKLKRPSAINYSYMRSFAPRIIECLEIEKKNAGKEKADEETDDVAPNEMETASNSTDDTSDADVISNLNEAMDMDVDINLEDNVDYFPAQQVPPLLPQHMQITPANVNVKEITRRCLEIICGCEAEGGEATFAYIFHKLRNNNVPVTPALVFSSLLQLANENNFHLKKIGENNFVIKRI